MEDEIKNVAEKVVHEIENGVAEEMCKLKNKDKSCTSRTDRSLLCVFFTPRMYFYYYY